MALNILELPLEMVAEVVKHVDYNGLLSLRRVSTLLTIYQYIVLFVLFQAFQLFKMY